MLRSQRNNLFIGLDINRITSILKNGKYNFERTEKPIDSIKDLLTNNINKSKLNIVDKNDLSGEDTEIKKEANDNDKNKTILTNSEIENNIWVQVTKETFDDLLLGNKTKDNSDDIFSNQKNISPENDDNSNNNTNIDDLENYFINSGFFLKNEDNKKKEKEKDPIFVPNLA